MSVPSLNPGPGSGWAKFSESPAAAILGYCLASISMTIVNKFVVSGDKWNMNFLFLLVQAVVGTLILVVCKQLGLIKGLAPFSKEKAQSWFPVSLCLIGMIYTGNGALRYLSVPVYTIFKNLTIIVIAYGEVLWFGASLTMMTLLSFALMVFSSVVAAWADYRYATTEPDEGSKESVMLLTAGFIWMALNVLCSAAYALSIRKFTKSTNFTNWDIMYYNNLLMMPVVSIATLALEDWSSDNLKSNFPPESRYTLPMGMIYSGIGALAITYCTAWVIRSTSSTTYAMVGALNKLPLAILGIIFFASPVTWGGIAAIALGFVSGLVYTWAKIRSSPAPPTEGAIPLMNVSVKDDSPRSSTDGELSHHSKDLSRDSSQSRSGSS
jgi:GDP-mannose transporter